MVDGKYEASLPFLQEYFKNGKVIMKYYIIFCFVVILRVVRR